MSGFPKISVITVVYNAADTIAKTLVSVRGQTYKNIEFIVIDGGSDDSTLSQIKEFDDIVSVQVSESDDGIYDAMNKGAGYATGEYITFLNAGDYYHSDDCLSEIFCDTGVLSYDVVYGSNYYFKNNKLFLQKPRPLADFYKGMPFNHQSVFVKSDLVKRYPFKHEVYRIQCEYQFLLNLYLSGAIFHEVDTIVAVYEAGGFSDMNFLERSLERWLIVKRTGICDAAVDKHYYSLVKQSFADTSDVNICDRAKQFMMKVKNRIRAWL
jgi:glycosyltransferase involved in cell wall biosynthesis